MAGVMRAKSAFRDELPSSMVIADIPVYGEDREVMRKVDSSVRPML